jgi:hypothetical protein
LLLPAMAGCSQAASLKPVAGDALASVSIATGDVLVENGIDLKVVPVCKADAEQFKCNGETRDGETVTAQTSGDQAVDLEVWVGKKQIFDGKVEDVLTKAARTS